MPRCPICDVFLPCSSWAEDESSCDGCELAVAELVGHAHVPCHRCDGCELCKAEVRPALRCHTAAEVPTEAVSVVDEAGLDSGVDAVLAASWGGELKGVVHSAITRWWQSLCAQGASFRGLVRTSPLMGAWFHSIAPDGEIVSVYCDVGDHGKRKVVARPVFVEERDGRLREGDDIGCEFFAVRAGLTAEVDGEEFVEVYLLVL